MTLMAIHGLDIPYPTGELLDCFVRKAINNERAANYILQRCSDQNDDYNAVPRFLAHWMELIEACKRIS
jgi:hypothetical protein